jgi:hypothetical protein
MSTHEIKADELWWTQFTFGDTEEAQAHLEWLEEQLEEETDPDKRRTLEDSIEEMCDVLFSAQFDLI